MERWIKKLIFFATRNVKCKEKDADFVKKKTIVLKAKDFKYPSTKERRIAENAFPRLRNFGFEYKADIGFIFQKEESFFDTNREYNLFWWDNYLLSKLGKINQSYVNVHAHYQRYLHENKKTESEQEININKIQFDFYSEIFYYFLFSARDVILQILNLYFNLENKENHVTLRKIKHKLADNSVKDLINEMEKGLYESAQIRNSFTHRFPKNQKDYRMVYSETDKPEQLEVGIGPKMQPSDIMENINKSLIIMKNWIDGIRENFDIKPNR